jgi:hypothetical protein
MFSHTSVDGHKIREKRESTPAFPESSHRNCTRRGGNVALNAETGQEKETNVGIAFKSLSDFSLVCVIAVLAGGECSAQMPQTSKEVVKGEAKVTKTTMKGTVVVAEGDTVLVKTSTGEMEEFQVQPSQKFLIDGKELTVSQLKPGTQLTATITTKTTPITERTTTIGSGVVWFATGSTLIVTLPNKENHMYTAQDSFRFMVDGKPASIKDLRKGMTISATKIVEEPRTDIVSNTVVTGTGPK